MIHNYIRNYWQFVFDNEKKKKKKNVKIKKIFLAIVGFFMYFYFTICTRVYRLLAENGFLSKKIKKKVNTGR